MKPRSTIHDYLKAAARRRRLREITPCLSDERVIAFYSGQLDGQDVEAVRDHLAVCPACRALARMTQTFLQTASQPVSAETETVPAEPPAPSWFLRHQRKLILLAAMALVAIGLALWFGRENPWRQLEVTKAEYPPVAAPPEDLVWRDAGAQNSFAQAMRSYQQNDFTGAELQLGQFLEDHPQHAEAHFYRGVSLLLLDRTSEAIGPLQDALEHGQDRVREEARWYLALAYLKLEELSKALAELDAVIVASGTHLDQAKRLRQRVQEAIGQ